MGVLTLGIVTGLAAEARLAGPLGMAEAGGGTPAGAGAAAERLAARGITGLVSFGVAGGLDPALAAGAVVVPVAVLEGAERFPTDPALSSWLGGAAGTLLAAGHVVAAPAAKQALFAGSGAVAVDLESGAVARVAQRHGLPFAVLRAVCDPAGRTLPAAALLALDAGGGIRAWRVAGAVLRRPGELPGLIALAADAVAARRALRRRVRMAAAARP